VDAAIGNGKLRSQCDLVEIAAADDDTSVYRFARVHSSWRISEILKYSDAITGGTAFEVGLHQTAANGGAVVDADAYASAVNLTSADTTGTNLAFEARNIDKIQNRVWQDAGLTSDPNRYYDLTMTGTTVGTAAGTVALEVRYVIE
jgi:hypothetical protein